MMKICRKKKTHAQQELMGSGKRKETRKWFVFYFERINIEGKIEIFLRLLFVNER
jgi:hypothetical protein